jgi:predicted ATP-grasp superfamily ATP-dependent carboligase
VVRRIGLVGPCKLDVIRDVRAGRWVLLEVNARYNLWHYLGAVHGINLLKVAYDYLTGGAVETMRAYRPNVRWCNLEAFAWDDPLPATRWLMQQVQSKVRGKVKGWHAMA